MLMGVLTACGNKGGNNKAGENTAKEDSGDNTFLSIATGGTGGTYYPLGGALATIINNANIGLQANAQATGASVENIKLIHNGDAEIAFIQNDTSYYAVNGIELFAEDTEKYDDLRALACLYPEVVQIVASDSSGIQTIDDLKGKKVAVGAPGSGVEVNARQVLEAHGISYDDLAKVDYLSFAEATDQIKNGQIDATFIVAAIPSSSVTELATTHDVHLVPIAEEVANKLIEKYPYYTYKEVDATEYRNQGDKVPSVVVQAMLVVNQSMSEENAYNITKAMFENLDVLGESHARGKDVSLETALDGMSIEVHPGAQKYYDEQK
ncbi:TRAP transporter solute receptor, TAXI family [Peptoniphilus sp. oral taxon 386 str. F0131]|nr:TRAP transporter solute receptor, TAXI family [Peptoniphilus sp. oral taxon 386 str. F0131]